MGQSLCVVECVCLSVYVSDRVRACSRACVVVVGRLGVCMCTEVWMGDNRNSIRKCGEKMRMVLLVGLRFYKQAPVYAARWIVERRIWES